MTILEAISLVDKLKANQYDNDTKVAWLDILDRHIYNDIILKHEMEAPEFNGYDVNTDIASTELLAPDEFREVYRWWLEMEIDKSNGEITKYNVSATLYNAAYHELASYYNREYMPKMKVNNISFIRRRDDVLPTV